MKPIRILVVAFLSCVFLFAMGPGEKYENNPVMNTGPYGAWDSSDLNHVSIIKTDTLYHLWYSAYGGGYNFQIGYATSEDGITWNKYIGNPVLRRVSGEWDEKAISGPRVLFEDGEYKMWYLGMNDEDVRKIGYATSPDGITWTKSVSNPVMASSQSWESNISYFSVIRDGSTYKMWYGDSKNSIYGIGYATSPDGITWTKHANNPVFQGESDTWEIIVAYPDIFMLDSKYHMFYTGTVNTSSAGGTFKKGYANSSDGVNWIRYSGNPVLSCGPESYDALGIWGSTTVPEITETDTILKLWYIGCNSGSDGEMNYATIQYPIITAIYNLTIPQRINLNQNYPNPFNPRTAISYELSTDSDVELTIYDVTGRKVETLISDYQSSGYYSVKWNASLFPSGIYFYRLKAGDFVDTKKMLIIK